MDNRNDDISLKLAKANAQGFFPDINDNELDALEQLANRLFLNDTRQDDEGLLVGEATIRRREISSNAASIASQSLRLTYFTAKKSEVISQISTVTGGTAAAATPTLCRFGVYKVESNGDLTLVASTANDTTLFAAATTQYTRSLQAPFNKIRGQRYAIGVLVVSGVATPTFHGHTVNQISITTMEPKQGALISGQADLPASITSASLSGAAHSQFHILLP